MAEDGASKHYRILILFCWRIEIFISCFVAVQLLSHVRLSATLWTVAHQVGSSVHGIFQARILEWAAISFSRRSLDPGIKLMSPALAGRFFTTEPPGKLIHQLQSLLNHSSLLKCKGNSDAYCVHRLADSMSTVPKVTYEFNTSPIKFPEGFFLTYRQADYKIYMEWRMNKNRWSNFEKEE